MSSKKEEKSQGKTILEYVGNTKMMEAFALFGSYGTILATIFLVYGVLGPDEPKWLNLLIIPMSITAIFFFSKLMLQMEKGDKETGEKLSMFWKFWRLFKQIFFSPLAIVFLYVITLSLLGTQISYLDKDLIYDNGGKLWTAVTIAHFITTSYYVYVLSNWSNLQEMVNLKGKSLDWMQTRKVNLVGMMGALLVIVSALTIFFYIEIVTKPVIG